jgi:hypothetical protein
MWSHSVPRLRVHNKGSSPSSPTDSPARMLRAAHGRLEFLFPVPRNGLVGSFTQEGTQGTQVRKVSVGAIGIGFRMDIATVGWCESQ